MPDKILRNIQFNNSSSHHSFEYDVDSGFLRNEDGSYLLFRAESPGAVPSLRSNGELDGKKLSSYGTGLYTGNTPESVAPYTWLRPGVVINAYLTPELTDEFVYNREHSGNADAIKEYVSMMRKRKALGWQAVTRKFDTEYGDTLLATRGAGLDISFGQALLSTTRHEISPRWGIWRGDVGDLSHVGTAQANSKPYRWAVKAAIRLNKRI